MSLRFNTLTLALAAMLPLSAAAQDADSMFSFRGYGTLGMVHSSEDLADFAPSDAPSGAGHTSNWSALPDSRLAAQVDAKFTDKFSGMVQVISEHGARETYRPELRLAQLKYAFTPSLSVRAGRLAPPIFMLSESYKIGYSMPWVRAPSEAYNLNVLIDGVELSKRFNFGNTALTVQAMAGASEKAGLKLSDTRTLAGTIENGSSTFFVSYSTVLVSSENAQLDQLLGFYRPALSALADQYRVNDDELEFASIGYNYDPGSWFARGEVTRTTGEANLVAKTTNLFVSAGVRVGEFTPYATYGKVKLDSPTSIGAADPIGVINGALAGSSEARQSLTIGSRWDFRESAALKLEFSRVDAEDGSNGGLTNLQPGFQRGGSYNLASVSIDFVF